MIELWFVHVDENCGNQIHLRIEYLLELASGWNHTYIHADLSYKEKNILKGK